MNTLSEIWLKRLELLDVAFQPILNIHTGKIFAVEALLRNFRDIGFKSIFDLFDTVSQENMLYTFDLALRKKTFKKFTAIKGYENVKLFYNLDNRLLSMPNYENGNTTLLLKKIGIEKENICFEISERHELKESISVEAIITHYKEENFYIAIDDFGIGYSGYKLLYDATPEIIKIDRYFLQNIDKEMKKQLMLRSIVTLAVQLGISVIAEGVETEGEFLVCKEMGCHLVQGYLVQRPTQVTQEISHSYAHINMLLKKAKHHSSEFVLKKHIQIITPLYKSNSMHQVVEYFKKNYNIPTVPVINSKNEPIGIFHENQIKEYLYSPFGMSLLHNNTATKSKLKSFILPCANADINSNIEVLIELFSNYADSAGIIITQDSLYYGFLSANAIISIMNEENLSIARDQNPLTKLPGNRMIQKYISNIQTSNHSYMLCYFDLDNFKAFNDVYGFRNGDRVIQLFADIMNRKSTKDVFKAHIGGDDFFIAYKDKENIDITLLVQKIRNLLQKFSQSAKEFYTQEDKEKGYISTKDRNGTLINFPLLTASASLLLIPTKMKNRVTEELINSILSKQKKVAKNEREKIAISCVI